MPQPHQALPPGVGAPIGGPVLLQQGVVVQGGYPQPAPIPGTTEAVQSWGHRGQQAPGQQGYQRGGQNPVSLTNSYSALDNRGRGPPQDNRGRGGSSYHNQNRY